ncbi:MAG: hypothetical protein ACRDTC_04095 [Pseudonocardiaceae bacterium]
MPILSVASAELAPEMAAVASASAVRCLPGLPGARLRPGAALDVVWWQLGVSTGRDLTSTQVRKWLEQRDQAADGVSGRDADDTVVLETTSE